jgi:hypothetical protein
MMSHAPAQHHLVAGGGHSVVAGLNDQGLTLSQECKMRRYKHAVHCEIVHGSLSNSAGLWFDS